MSGTLKTPYNHTEAFRLMNYVCQGCGHRLIIWNSRDGVTPFTLNCKACGKSQMQHIDWQLDRLAPHHIPRVGDWIWVDMPAKKCKKLGVPIGSPRLIQVDVKFLQQPAAQRRGIKS